MPVQQLGRFPTEVGIEEQMFGRAGNPFLAAEDVRNLHEMIVDDVCQMVRRESVRFHQDLHVDGRPIELDLPAAQIFDDANSAIGNLQPNDVRLAGSLAPIHFLHRITQTEAVVPRRRAGRALSDAHLLQPSGRTEALERVARSE
jgi:hypothetical protein